MTVRQATEGDLSHWSRMRDALWPDAAPTNSDAIAQFFAGESIHITVCLLAIAEELPVGFIELNLRGYAEGSHAAEIPYVEGWFVDAAYRGQGFGRQLMGAAEAWALENGFSELASDAELENDQSIAAHKKLGFTETDRIVCFLKDLT